MLHQGCVSHFLFWATGGSFANGMNAGCLLASRLFLQRNTLLQACFSFEISTASFLSPLLLKDWITRDVFFTSRILFKKTSETLHRALHFEYYGLLQISTRRWGCAWVLRRRERSMVQCLLSVLTMTAHVCCVALLKDKYDKKNTHTHTFLRLH